MARTREPFTIRTGGRPPLVHDRVPQQLGVQVCRVLEKAIPQLYNPGARVYSNALEDFAFAHGIEVHPSVGKRDADSALQNLARDGDLRFLDLVEYIGQRAIEMEDANELHVDPPDRPPGLPVAFRACTVPEALDEVDELFRRAGFGYKFEGGHIVRVADSIVHASVVTPTFELLAEDPDYKAASNYYHKAHGFIRSGDMEEAHTNAGKALESTLKTIISKRGWTQKGDTLKRLLEEVIERGLLPQFQHNYMKHLELAVLAGTGQPRNKAGAHGAQAPLDIPVFVADFTLHATAAAIILLIRAERALP